MLNWFRNRWPDPRIKEREEELRTMVERHEQALKAWSSRFARLQETHDRLVAMPPEAKVVYVDRIVEKPVEVVVEVQKPVYIDKIVDRIVESTVIKASPELVEDNRVLRKKLELALGRLHTWDHNQAISIEKMKARDL